MVHSFKTTHVDQNFSINFWSLLQYDDRIIKPISRSAAGKINKAEQVWEGDIKTPPRRRAGRFSFIRRDAEYLRNTSSHLDSILFYVRQAGPRAKHIFGLQYFGWMDLRYSQVQFSKDTIRKNLSEQTGDDFDPLIKPFYGTYSRDPRKISSEKEKFNNQSLKSAWRDEKKWKKTRLYWYNKQLIRIQGGVER